MKIAILTSKNQWFIPYAKQLTSKIKNCTLLFTHTNINTNYDICFILSYHNIIPREYLQKNLHNIVIHASDLPQGKGFAPMFWQILENKNNIVFSMFEANDGVDSGDIYIKKSLLLNGYELYDELREKQANFIIELCLDFIKNYDSYKKPRKQEKEEKENIYAKRTKKDSKLDINKSIKEQFNLLRICDNDNFPAFFEIDGNKYKLSISKILP